MPRHLIAFAGPKGSGKSTAASVLYSGGYMILRFADPLKAMLRALGLNDAQLNGDLKEVPCELLGGHKPRYAMQTLGTEWGRQMINSGLWVGAWVERVKRVPNHISVVCDDCRFEDEVKAIRSLGGTIVMVHRPGFEPDPNGHPSERFDWKADEDVHNDCDETTFRRGIETMYLKRDR